MIDRSLNYGRHLISQFMQKSLPFETVLDIGAGGGADLMSAREINHYSRLFALESFPPNVEKLRASGIEVHQANIERDRFPFKDGSIDVIIANQILEHTKDVFWIMHEVSRILPIGGHLILGVPNLASLHNRLLLLLGRQPSPIKTNSAHVRGFTKGDLLRFVDDCFPGGYQLSDFGGSNFYPFPPLVAKSLASVLPNMAWGIFLLLEKKRDYVREFLDYPVTKQLETNFYLGES